MDKKTNSIRTSDDDEDFCIRILANVSRKYSFANGTLEAPLRRAVCVLYLILRFLDIIEDDTTLEDAAKLEALKTFSTHLDASTVSPASAIGHHRLKRTSIVKSLRPDCNKHYAELIENFDKVLNVFGRCSTGDNKTIRDVVDEMAKGMIKYANKSVDTVAEYEDYCYYVAGTVGVGLTKLFETNGVLDMGNLDHVDHSHLHRIAVAAGTFLQKVNILRDISEDLSQPTERVYIPKEVWSKFVKEARHLIDENYRSEAIACRNYLINDAFRHLPDSIEYLSLISEKSAFQFLAVPICVAVSSLEKLFGHPPVANSVVKIDITDMVNIFENVKDMETCVNVMKSYLLKLSTRIGPSSPFGDTTNWISRSVECIGSSTYMCK